MFLPSRTGFWVPTKWRSTSAAAGPAEKPEPVVGEEVAEEARPHSLEREDQGDPGGADAPLRPDLDQVAQRAREDPRDDEGSPYRPAARDRELAERQRDEQKTEERGRHLHECQRHGVVPG